MFQFAWLSNLFGVSEMHVQKMCSFCLYTGSLLCVTNIVCHFADFLWEKTQKFAAIRIYHESESSCHCIAVIARFLIMLFIYPLSTRFKCLWYIITVGVLMLGMVI